MLVNEISSSQSISAAKLEPDSQFNTRLQHNIDILRQFKQGDLTSVTRYSGFGGLRQALKQEEIQSVLAEFLTPECVLL